MRRGRGGITAEIDPGSLREIEGALEAAGKDAVAAVAAGVRRTAEAAAELERSLVPVRTGALRGGITVRYSETGASAQVGIWDPELYYALFVEWGTSTHPAHPFGTPAAEEASTRFVPNVVSEVRKRVG